MNKNEKYDTFSFFKNTLSWKVFYYDLIFLKKWKVFLFIGIVLFIGYKSSKQRFMKA